MAKENYKYVSLLDSSIMFDTIEEVTTARTNNPSDDRYKDFEKKIILSLDEDVTEKDIRVIKNLRNNVQDDCIEFWGDEDPNQGGGIILYGRSVATNNLIEIKYGGTVVITINKNGIITMPNLPTEDPNVAGGIYNDSDYLTVSATV